MLDLLATNIYVLCTGYYYKILQVVYNKILAGLRLQVFCIFSPFFSLQNELFSYRFYAYFRVLQQRI